MTDQDREKQDTSPPAVPEESGAGYGNHASEDQASKPGESGEENDEG